MGLRYLKQLDVGLVREALHERAVLLKIAPHLVEPQPFLCRWRVLRASSYYGVGLTVYDWLAGNHAVPRHLRLPLEEVRRLEPGLAVPGMTAAVEFHDAQVRSARLVLENIFEAIANGAACANYVRAEGQEHSDLWHIRLRDTISGEAFDARAHILVDATGPWSHDPAPRLVRGSHIVLPRLNASDHAIAYFEDAGRIVFFIPWGERGDRTLIGTTDVDHPGSPDDVHISQAETDYLRNVAAKVFPESAKYEPLATFSSLRPLLPSAGSATRASREHRIFYDSHGILRITGGKFTTYRAMSQEAADLITSQIAPALQSVHLTADHALNGNTPAAIESLMNQVPELAAQYSVDRTDITLTVKQYGLLTPTVLDCMPDHATAGLSRLDAGRFTFAARHEMAIKPRDFLEVSTSLGLEGRVPGGFTIHV